MFPNPTGDILNITSPSASDKRLNVSVFDVFGRLLLKTSINAHSDQISMCEFKAGIYQVQTELEGLIQAQKIIN